MIIKKLICPYCNSSLGGTAVYGTAVRLGSKRQQCPTCKRIYSDMERLEWSEMTPYRKFEFYILAFWFSFITPILVAGFIILVCPIIFKNSEGEWRIILISGVGVLLLGLGIIAFKDQLQEIDTSKSRCSKRGSDTGSNKVGRQ
jgi:hypothetical protein